MALTREQATALAERCSVVLAAGVVKLLVASPNPGEWTDTRLRGALMLAYDEENDLHSFRLYGLEHYHLLFEAELYEDVRMHQLSDRLLAWEADDFMVGFLFSLAIDCSDFFVAVAEEAPRSSDSLQLLMFKQQEEEGQESGVGKVARFLGMRGAQKVLPLARMGVVRVTGGQWHLLASVQLVVVWMVAILAR